MFGPRVAVALAATSLLLAATTAAPAANLTSDAALVTTETGKTWVCSRYAHVEWGAIAGIPADTPVALYLTRLATDPAQLLDSKLFSYSDQSAYVSLDCSSLGITKELTGFKVAVAFAEIEDNSVSVLAMSQAFTVSGLRVTGPVSGTTLYRGQEFVLEWVSASADGTAAIALYGKAATGNPVLIAWLDRTAANTGSAVLTVPATVKATYVSLVLRITTGGFSATSPYFPLGTGTAPTATPTATPKDLTDQGDLLLSAQQSSNVTSPARATTPIAGFIGAISELARGVVSVVSVGVSGGLQGASQMAGGAATGLGAAASGAMKAVQSLLLSKPVTAIADVTVGVLDGLGTAAQGVVGGLTSWANIISTGISTAIGSLLGAKDALANGITWGRTI